MNNDISSRLDQLRSLVDRAAGHLRGDLDQEQIELYDLAFSLAEISAAQSLNRLADSSNSELLTKLSAYYAADTFATVSNRFNARPQSYGLTTSDVPTLSDLCNCLDPGFITSLGQALLDEGLPEQPLEEAQRIIRDTFRGFADEVVAPLAEEIHRQDLIIPDEILQPLREMGCFGLSVPERFGGLKPGRCKGLTDDVRCIFDSDFVNVDHQIIQPRIPRIDAPDAFRQAMGLLRQPQLVNVAQEGR